MFTLAIDTATEVVAVGLGRREADGNEVLVVRDEAVPRAAMSRLLPLVRDVLSDVAVAVEDLDEVVVGRGPGSFTGVRIGVATAKGITHGLDIPLYGVGTLDAVAALSATEDGLVGIVGDAMRGEVYPCLFRCERGECRRLEEYTVATPEGAARVWATISDEPLRLAGSGLAKYADVFREALGERAVLTPREFWQPSGRSLLQVAWGVPPGERGEGSPGELLPIYTRLSDAEEKERRVRENEGERDVVGDGSGVPPQGVAGPTDGQS